MNAPTRRDLMKLLAAAGATVPLSAPAAARVMADPATDAASRPASLAALARAFADPPADARPGIFWYWMNGNVTRAGITADLEALAANGLRTVMLFSIGGRGPGSIVEPSAQSLTPYWWELVRFAVAECDRLGLEMALNACDGWATASGPWITSELSMKRLVWSECEIVGGKPADPVLALPTHPTEFYRDLRVVAFPHPASWGAALPVPQVSGSLAGADERLVDVANTAIAIDSDTAGDVVLDYGKAVTLRSVTIRTPPFPGPFAGVQRAAHTLFVDASGDGDAWSPVVRLDYPWHGWETGLTDLTHALPPTRARRFRFRYRPEEATPFREDLYHAGPARLRLIGLLPSNRPCVPLLPLRTGSAWGRAAPLDDRRLASADCVPFATLVDLTAMMRPDATLDWHPPPGRWSVLRIGYGSTGKANSMAGGGQGLECDKLSAVAATVQFDGWFGRALEMVGPDLAGRVLHVFHVDSWEAGSQNWTDDFAREFNARRGYDLMPRLAVMAGVPVDGADPVDRLLFDVRRTIAELVQDRFFGTVAALARDHGCIVSAETVNPTMIADGLDYGATADVPMGEFWLRSPQNEKPHDIADAVSTAHVHGRPIAGAEAFTEWNLAFDETPWMLKARGDRHYATGINRFYLHVDAHQPWLDRAPGQTLFGVGTFFGRTQTWWRPGKAWIDYLARSQALLQAGRPVVDVAMFIGEDIPVRSVLRDELPVRLPAGYRHDSIDRPVLLHRARVEDGALILGDGMRYRMLLLPDDTRMTPDLAEALAGFAARGLPIVGPAPTRAPGAAMPADADRRVAAAGRAMRPTAYAAFGALLARTCPPAMIVSGVGADAVDWTHRGGDGWQLFFVSNQADAAITATLDLRCAGRPYLWCADRGSTEPAPRWSRSRERTRVTLSLSPRDARFVVVDTRSTALPRIAPAARDLVRVAPSGGWLVRFPGIGDAHWPRLARWDRSEDERIRHFSGTAHYETTIRLMPSVATTWLLDLGAVADLAEVWLNGRSLGVAWKPPFVLDATAGLRPGANRIEIAVTNTWRNRLIGDAGRADRTSFVVPDRHFGKPWEPGPNDALLPAGLVGPVVLRGMSKGWIDR